MRKIRLFAHISLDGVIAPAARIDGDDEYVNGGWMAPYRTLAGRDLVTQMQGSGFDLLLGRRTYDLWADFWPNAGDNPIANSLNAATKYVVTHWPDSLEWEPVGRLGGDFIEGVRSLKSTEGADLIVWGSSTITSALLELGLIDDVVLMVYPVWLGQGIRLFSDNAGLREFTLLGSQATPSGVLVNTYKCVKAPKAA